VVAHLLKGRITCCQLVNFHGPAACPARPCRLVKSCMIIVLWANLEPVFSQAAGCEQPCWGKAFAAWGCGLGYIVVSIFDLIACFQAVRYILHKLNNMVPFQSA